MKAKKLIRQFVATPKKQKPVSLCHLIINIKSHWGNSFYSNTIKRLLLNAAYEWNFGKKQRVIDLYGDRCFTPNFSTFHNGAKTVLIDGKFCPEIPWEHIDEMPF